MKECGAGKLGRPLDQRAGEPRNSPQASVGSYYLMEGRSAGITPHAAGRGAPVWLRPAGAWLPAGPPLPPGLAWLAFASWAAPGLPQPRPAAAPSPPRGF